MIISLVCILFWLLDYIAAWNWQF